MENRTENEVKPSVGMGATHYGYTDRHPYTVIRVSETGKTVWVQEDTAIRVDQNGMSECQTYTYKPNPQGEVLAVRLCKDGRWRSGWRRFALGERRAYYDYSF